MKRHALILALVLAVPLALYGVPYAYANTASSSYVMSSSTSQMVHCNSGDYATGGGGIVASGSLRASEPVKGTSVPTSPADGAPDGWYIDIDIAHSLTGPSATSFIVFVVCQTPITVAGVTAPEFGQLYVAIALGALVYFLMAKRYSGTKPISVRPS
jgi:hypothetical protein